MITPELSDIENEIINFLQNKRNNITEDKENYILINANINKTNVSNLQKLEDKTILLDLDFKSKKLINVNDIRNSLEDEHFQNLKQNEISESKVHNSDSENILKILNLKNNENINICDNEVAASSKSINIKDVMNILGIRNTEGNIINKNKLQNVKQCKTKKNRTNILDESSYKKNDKLLSMNLKTNEFDLKSDKGDSSKRDNSDNFRLLDGLIPSNCGNMDGVLSKEIEIINITDEDTSEEGKIVNMNEMIDETVNSSHLAKQDVNMVENNFVDFNENLDVLISEIPEKCESIVEENIIDFNTSLDNNELFSSIPMECIMSTEKSDNLSGVVFAENLENNRIKCSKNIKKSLKKIGDKCEGEFSTDIEKNRSDMTGAIDDLTCVYSEDDDFIEEIVVKEKLNVINNSNKNVTDHKKPEEMVLQNTISMEDLLKEKQQLLYYLEILNEAISFNILIRNDLYDIEHILLKLLEASKGSIDRQLKIIENNKPFYKKKRNICYKFLSPYFKDNRGISSPNYFTEEFSSSLDIDCYEFVKYYRQNTDKYNLIEIYKIIENAFKRNDEFHLQSDESKQNKIKKKPGRHKMYLGKISYNSSDGFSMEMQFNNFINYYSKRGSDNYYINDEYFNWNNLIIDSEQEVSSIECKQIWYLILKPLIQLGKWTQQENIDLYKIAKKYNYQNWEEIAFELGTGRSAYLCFCHVMNKAIQGVTHNGGNWTDEEDEFLIHLVKKCSYGNNVMWNRIFYLFDDRTVTQILNRWYRLNPLLKRGKFSHREDLLLMYFVNEFGRDFGKIASLFGNRSPVQLRERFFAIKDVIEENKLGEWSLEEDRLLLILINEYGEANWATIAKQFPNRNRTQIRHRYNSVLKHRLNENPKLNLESLKRYRRNTNYTLRTMNRMKNIDPKQIDIRPFVKNLLKRGDIKLKRILRAGKLPKLD